MGFNLRDPLGKISLCYLCRDGDEKAKFGTVVWDVWFRPCKGKVYGLGMYHVWGEREGGHLKDPGIDGRKLKWILETWDGGHRLDRSG